jgi:hypothetical protein
VLDALQRASNSYILPQNQSSNQDLEAEFQDNLVGNMQNFQSDPFAFLQSQHDQDLDDQHPIRDILLLLKKSIWPAFNPKEQQIDDDNKELSSDQLIAKYELERKKGETLFILPEY